MVDKFLLIPALLYLIHKLWKRKHLRLPPGPSPLPIIGNVHQITQEHSYLTFAEWGKRYGPVTYLSILGKPLVVLNTSNSALDLLERRGANYANRPRLVMAGEIVGYENAVTLAPYDYRHRERRKLIYEAFSSRKVSRYHEFGERRARKLMVDLLHDPGNFQRHITGYVAATVFDATHGHEVARHDDPLITLAEQCGADFCEMVRPGAFLVDIFPFLRYIPEWLPFAGFKRKAKVYRDTADKMRDIPYDLVKEKLADGTAKPSLTANILEAKPNRTPEEDFSYRWLTATVYTAGADTSSSVLVSFIMAMALYPEVQERAQAELDSVLGSNRLPTFADRDSLPYIRALCLELLRLYCPTPIGLPHLAIGDDEYMGYHIPAGATVIANSWAILHDPANYAEPERLIPERFAASNVEDSDFLDPRAFAFGYGRRVCPGREFAEGINFITVATILSLFEITPAVSGPPSGEFTSTLVIRPKPFKCSIKPRSPEAEKLIRDVEGVYS